MKPMIMIALDNDPFYFVEILGRSLTNIGFKINLDYILKVGIKQASRLKDFGKPLFADLKMWNGKRTMMSILEQLGDAGFEYANVHILAGPEIPKMNFVYKQRNDSLKLLGVALLTHYNENYGIEFFDRDTSIEIVDLIEKGNKMPLDGIVAGANYMPYVSNEKIKVTPGIRPSWYEDKRHSNAVTPKKALDLGSDILVIGSPITKNKNPLEALNKIWEEINETDS